MKRRQEHISDKFASLVSLSSADPEDGTTSLDFLVHESVPSLVLVSVKSVVSDSSVTPWTVACQGPQSMEFSRQEYWSGLPFPSPTLKRQAAMEELLCLAKKLQTFASCPKNRPFTLCHLLPHSCVERG